jgi:hypothetical protein
MHFCKICNYYASSNYLIKKHYKTQKHIINLNSDGLFTCSNCSTKYRYKTGLERHSINCIPIKNNTVNNIANNTLNDNFNIEFQKLKLETETLKENYELKLKVKDYELKVKDLENKNLQLQIQNNNNGNISNSHNINTNTNNNTNNTNNTNTNNNNNIKISKVEYLNLNFSDVIDMDTFINNYENDFGLTNEQTETLLFNQKNGGINSCISSLAHYIKDSIQKQYEMRGKKLKKSDAILPFLLSDKYLRDHFEKNINGQWDKTTSKENIRRIINITERQIFKHHNEFMALNNAEQKKLINGMLKSSCFSQLSNMSDSKLYISENK